MLQLFILSLIYLMKLLNLIIISAVEDMLLSQFDIHRIVILKRKKIKFRRISIMK